VYDALIVQLDEAVKGEEVLHPEVALMTGFVSCVPVPSASGDE
jgi:hypothetical protein